MMNEKIVRMNYTNSNSTVEKIFNFLHSNSLPKSLNEKIDATRAIGKYADIHINLR